MANNNIPVDVVPDETVRALKIAQSLSDSIYQHRGNTVQYPFEAGTKTLKAKSLDEEKRQFDKNYELNRAETMYSINRPYSSGGGGGGGSSRGSQAERFNEATSQLLGTGQQLYRAFYKEGQEKGLENGGYPLYYAIEYMFRNPNINKAIVDSGADRKAAIDNLIYQYSGVTPEEYFSKGQGAGLRKLYEELLTKKAGKAGTQGNTTLNW